MNQVLFALWFFLPAGVANAAPAFINKFSVLKKNAHPIDNNRKFRGKRLFGQNKTELGFLLGVLFSLFTIILEKVLYQNFEWVRSFNDLVNYANWDILLLGFLLGFGALFGDLVESFFKRQATINSGNSWFPFDQIDYIIGGCLFALIFIRLPYSYYLIILVVWFLLHLVASFIGYTFGIKPKPI